MLKADRLFALFLIFVFGGAVIIAQNPAPKVEKIEGEIQILADGDGSYLGVQTAEVTKENFGRFGLKEVRGVAIEKVLENSPAKQAGLQDGDVIVRFNGEEVTGFRKLARLIGEVAPDHQVKLTVVRGGSEREFNVTMGRNPNPRIETDYLRLPVPRMPESGEMLEGLRIWRQGLPLGKGEFGIYPPTFNGDILIWRSDGEGGSFVFGSPRQIGVGITSLTKQLGDYFGVADGKGVLIDDVIKDSPAEKAGLKAGDVIVEIDGKPVAKADDLVRGINEKKEGEVTLTIVRNKNRQTVKVTPEKVKDGEMLFKVAQPRALRAIPNERKTNPAPRVRMTAPLRLRTKMIL